MSNYPIKSIKTEEFNKSIEDMTTYLTTYSSKEAKDAINERLTKSIFTCNTKIQSLIESINKLQVLVNSNKKLKDQIQSYINGTFININVVINTEMNLSVNIDVLSDENLSKLSQNNMIDFDIYNNEKIWRNIMKDYPTNEDKNKYVLLLCTNIKLYEEEINIHINNIHIIEMIKLQIYDLKNQYRLYNMIDNL